MFLESKPIEQMKYIKNSMLKVQRFFNPVLKLKVAFVLLPDLGAYIVGIETKGTVVACQTWLGSADMHMCVCVCLYSVQGRTTGTPRD
jgi:hypothetical protein